MLKVNNANTRTRYEICSKFTPCSSVSIVNFEQVNAGWDGLAILKTLTHCAGKYMIYPIYSIK